MKRVLLFTAAISLLCSVSFAATKESKLKKAKESVNAEVGISQEEYESASSAKTKNTKKNASNSESASKKLRTSKYYKSGYDGEVTTLVILEPKGQRLDRNNEWFLSQIQTQLIDNFTLFSPIIISDRQNTDEAQKEIELQENGTFSESAQGAIFGKAVGAEYMLTGVLTDNGRDFSLSLRINNITENTAVTSYSTKCNAKDIKDGTTIKNATKEILEQLGVELTEAGLEKLFSVDEASQKRQENLSKGINASKRGTSIEAMQYYYAAAEYSLDDYEINSRLNAIQTAINSGNLGDQAAVGNKVFKNWQNQLLEAEDYFRRNPPYDIIYDIEPLNVTNLLDRPDLYDARNDIVRLPFKIGAIASTSAKNTLKTTINAINALPEAIKKEFEEWPQVSVGEKENDWLEPGRFIVVVNLLNENDKILSSKKVGLNIIGPALLDEDSVSYSQLQNNMRNIYFENIKGSNITDVLTVEIASVIYNDTEISTENIHISTMQDIEEPLMAAQKIENERQRIEEKIQKEQRQKEIQQEKDAEKRKKMEEKLALEQQREEAKLRAQEAKKEAARAKELAAKKQFNEFNERIHKDSIYWTFDIPLVDSTFDSDFSYIGTSAGFDYHLFGPVFWGINGGLFFKTIEYTVEHGTYYTYTTTEEETEIEFNLSAEAGLNYTFPEEIISIYAKVAAGIQNGYLPDTDFSTFTRIAAGIDILYLNFEYSFDFNPYTGDSINRLALGVTYRM